IKDSSGEIVPDQETDLSVKVPGGGIQSTAADLIKFGHAMLNNKLIKAETLQMMATDQQYKKNGNPYGLGWFLYANKNAPSGRIIGHSGSQAGTSTQFMIYLDKKMVIATLSNTAGTWSKILGLNNKLGELVIDPAKLKAPLKKAIPMSQVLLDRYSGRYEGSDGKIIRLVRKGNALYLDPEDHNQQKMFAASENSFFFRSNSLAGATVDFDFNSTNQVAKMTLNKADGTQQFTRRAEKSFAWALYNVFDEKDSKAAAKWLKQNQEKSQWDFDIEEMKIAAYNLLNKGIIIEALEMLKINVKRFPKNPEALDEDVMVNVGNQLLRAEANDLAIEFFALNTKVFDESAEAHNHLAKAYATANKTKMAIKSYEKSLELNPDNEKGKAALLQLKGGD
ncbi:MAG: serine hydrolase, partial [Bacteroidota bacterium]